MVPLLWLGGAAALFLWGCAGTEKTPPPETPKHPPPPDLPHHFQDDGDALKVYRQLRDKGVFDPDLDVGCHFIDYNKPGPNETHSGQGNGMLEACEIYEFALDRYDSYKEIVEGIAEGPVPWTLNEQGPPTVKGNEIRAKVQHAIAELKKILDKQQPPLDPQTYQEKMAVGLFYFVLFPSHPLLILNNKLQLLDFSKELADPNLGLNEFQDYLFYSSGLGNSETSGDAPLESTPLETIRTKTGWCTEWSKVLYAVFRLAGLKPFFVWTSLQDDPPAFIRDKLNDRFALGHVYIGLKIGDRFRYFDPSFQKTNIQYKNNYHWGLIHYLSGDFLNRGRDIIHHQNKLSEGIENTHKAIKFDPNHPVNHNNLAMYLMRDGKIKEAIAEMKRAAQLGAKEKLYQLNLSLALLQGKELDAGIQAAQEVIALDPDNARGYLILGVFQGQKGKIPEAETSLRRAIEIDPIIPMAHRNLGVIFTSQKKFQEAEIMFQKELQINPRDEVTYYEMGVMYYDQEKWEQAMEAAEEALRINPQVPDGVKLKEKIREKQNAPATTTTPDPKNKVQTP